MSRIEGLVAPFGAAESRGPDASLDPTVSVIVPTFRRPRLVVEAVRSALAQGRRDIEVVVVIDGEDAEDTLGALAEVGDARLSVLCPGRRLGNAAARNLGLAAARAPWIALLDDDDLWMPDKIERQLAAAEAARAVGIALPIVSCRFEARSETDAFVWPRRLPPGGRAEGRAVGDYVMCRRRPPTGDGVVQTSTVLAPAELFARCPFDAACRRFVDVDWLLRAARVEGVALLFASPEAPLAVWRIDDRPRVSLQDGWRDDVAWMRARRHLVSPRACAAFMLTLPSIRAARERDPWALPALLREAFAVGRPGWAELAFHLGNFAVGPRARRVLARLGGG